MLLDYSLCMNVSLPRTWAEFVAGQVSSGEFGNASEVVREALRLLREQQESRAVEDMRPAFAKVDPHGGQGEPGPADRGLIDQLIRRHRKGKVRS
jgi:putative addiction module CopG family antidote